MENQRTKPQNNSIHLWLRLVSQELTKNGHTITTVLNKMKRGVELPVTEAIAKDILWRPVQKAMFNKESSAELTKQEVDRVFEPINKFLGEQFEIHIPFPAEDEVMHREN